jgi:hypothetical protein
MKSNDTYSKIIHGVFWKRLEGVKLIGSTPPLGYTGRRKSKIEVRNVYLSGPDS